MSKNTIRKREITFRLVLIFSILIVISLFTSFVSADSVDTKIKYFENMGYKVTHEQDGNIRVDIENIPNKQISAQSESSLSCYSVLVAHWQTAPIKYIINPTNPQGLTQKFIASRVSKAAETWDNKTSLELFNNTFKINKIISPGNNDGKNVIGFADYPNPNAVAVTSLWFDSELTKIIEFDQTYNTRFQWGDATQNHSKYDLQNALTHEFGHSIGLDHVFQSQCSETTMYPSTVPGETKKRTLTASDVSGLRFLYGN